MCMDDYLIKTAHYFCQGKIALLATHQMLTRALSSTDQSQHKNLSASREKSCYSHAGRIQFLFSVAIVHSAMLEATKRPVRKCVSL